MSFEVFHGTDYFRLERALARTLLGRKLTSRDLSHFDGIEHPPSPTDLYQAAFSGSLFGPSNAILLTHAGAWIKHEFGGRGGAVEKKGGVDAADLATLNELTHAPDDVTIIFLDTTGPLPKTPQSVWKAIESGAAGRITLIDQLKFIPFAPNVELERLIEGIARDLPGLVLAPDAVRTLGWRVGSDLGLIWSELQKYRDWCLAHPGGAVTPDLVREATVPVVDVYIFDLIDAIAGRQLKRALSLLHLVLQGGEAAPKVGVLIHRQYKLMFWALLATSESGQGSVASRLGVPDWQARKLLQTAKGYDRRQIPAVLRMMVETDRQLKTSALPPDIALEMLVTRLCTIT
ncbi:MAG: DNA polymerase III subunit delta [bacterium]